MDNKRQGRNVFVSTFRVPDEYERSRMEAERRAALAEMLEAQAYQPLNVNQPAPIAPSQGLAKVLKQYMGAYEKRKAREAEEKAKGEELETAAEIQGRLMGVDQLFDRDETGEMQSIYATPEQQQAQIEADIARQRATGQLEEMTPTAQYQRDPMDALRLASTPAGIAATRGNPTLAAMLQKSMETPAAEEFYAPVVGEGGRFVQFGKRGGVRESDVTARPQDAPAVTTTTIIGPTGKPIVVDARTGREIGSAVPTQPREEPLERVIGPDGKPTLVRRSEAEGMQPFTAPTKIPASTRMELAKSRTSVVEFENASNQTQKFIKDIEGDKLDLYKGAGLIYKGKRAFGGDEVFEEGKEPDYVRYFQLERFVTEQVNRILNLAKGPQTDQDALRARQQILDNLDNKQVVLSALRDLNNIWKREVDEQKSFINFVREEFDQPGQEIIDLPPRN
jgi:hypothetical protein